MKKTNRKKRGIPKFTFRVPECFKKDKSHQLSHWVPFVMEEVRKEMTRVPDGPDL